MRRIAAACACMLPLAAPVQAQVSGSITVVSDYRYRGVSLSAEEAAVQAGIAYDHESGWYGGAFGSTVQLIDRSHQVQGVAYAGFARRLRSDLSWDCGASFATFSGRYDYDYAEVFCGVVSDKLSAKLFYSPNYYNLDSQSLYFEINGALPLRDRLSLTAHGGALQLHRRNTYFPVDPHRYDVRIGVSLDLDWARAQLAWVASNRATGIYPVYYEQSKQAVVLSLSRQF